MRVVVTRHRDRSFVRGCLICVAMLIVGSAKGGTVEQATIIADPQMQVKDGSLQGCGYRLKGIPLLRAGLTHVLALDASFNIYSEGTALLKGGAVQIPVRAGKPVNKPIESFWLKVQGEKATTPLKGRALAAETKGYLLHGTSFEVVMQLFEAVLEEKPITIGMRVKGEPVDRIYTGTIQLPDSDKAQGARCLDELAKQMKTELEPEPSK